MIGYKIIKDNVDISLDSTEVSKVEMKRKNEINVKLIKEESKVCRLSKDNIIYIKIDVISKSSSSLLISLEVDFLE